MSERDDEALQVLWELTPAGQVAELRLRLRDLLAALEDCPETDAARHDPDHPLWLAAGRAEFALERTEAIR